MLAPRLNYQHQVREWRGAPQYLRPPWVGHELIDLSAESVLPSITDLSEMRWRVRFVPCADIAWTTGQAREL